ncbi:MAG TPA: class I SAM-dependent methyltransferase [Acidobacteriaceae bacterium]|jgi:SAM-dependent methyltransferase|nr:class I SAM-dependent methyltransferase [Acidobacteriaceae bacterium]
MNILVNPAPSIVAEPAAANPQSLAPPNFNHLADIYRWLEYLSFGPLLWRCRIRFLPRLAFSRRALVLGDGDGRFTARLLRDNQSIQVHAIDSSPRMLDTLQRAATPHRSRLTTEVADLRHWHPAQSAPYDLIVTHFFLDCLTTGEIASLTRRLAPAIHADALWLVSEFATPNTAFGRMIAAPLVASLYRAFRLLTGLGPQSLPNHAEALSKSGGMLECEDRHICGLLVSQLWRLQPLDASDETQRASTPK